eukprot:362077-Chlamydomonas_euryale.AAC.17
MVFLDLVMKFVSLSVILLVRVSVGLLWEKASTVAMPLLEPPAGTSTVIPRATSRQPGAPCFLCVPPPSPSLAPILPHQCVSPAPPLTLSMDSESAAR